MPSVRRARGAVALLLSLSVLVLLAACGGEEGAARSTPSPPVAPAASPTSAAPSPSAVPAPTVAELRAVVERIYKRLPGGYSAGCTADIVGDRDLCPISDRLAAFLTHPVRGPGPGPVNYFCRCQNGDPTILEISGVPEPGGGVAHVHWGYSHVDLVIVRMGGRLLVDDIRCPGGGPETSTYVVPLPACPANR